MNIVENRHWGFYAWREKITGVIEYLHHDGQWGKQAEYFKTEGELQKTVNIHSPSFAVSSVTFMNMKVGISDFAKKRHVPDSGFSYFQGTWDELIQCIKDHWASAVPGQGETTLTRKILITVPPDRFVGTTATLQKGMALESKVGQRQDGEDLFVSTRAVVDINNLRQPHLTPDPVVKVEVVLYSREALLENGGTLSGNFDWEVVAILAKTSENEPMQPLTMARNFLEKQGGTKSVYSAREFAEAIYFWSQRVSV